jgi:hypothetical protein
MALISNHLLALLLTLVIETAVALLFGYRKRGQLEAVVLVNLITNPALNYLIALAVFSHAFAVSLPVIIGAELAVVLIEWQLLAYVWRDKSPKPLALSLAMNACSYIVGTLFF